MLCTDGKKLDSPSVCRNSDSIHKSCYFPILFSETNRQWIVIIYNNGPVHHQIIKPFINIPRRFPVRWRTLCRRQRIWTQERQYTSAAHREASQGSEEDLAAGARRYSARIRWVPLQEDLSAARWIRRIPRSSRCHRSLNNRRWSRRWSVSHHLAHWFPAPRSHFQQ